MKGRGSAHGLACATAAATVGLIVAGGLVTNTGAALAVPDCPTTFGHNLFLFPWSGMVGGVLVEHGHRLLGAVIGMLTIALAAALALGDGRRWVRGLGLLAVLLVLLHFALPFMLLLSRTIKQHARSLATVAGLVFVVRFLDLYWVVTPAFFPYQGFSLHWMDLAAVAGVGGLWLAVFLSALRSPLLPVNLEAEANHG